MYEDFSVKTNDDFDLKNYAGRREYMQDSLLDLQILHIIRKLNSINNSCIIYSKYLLSSQQPYHLADFLQNIACFLAPFQDIK